MTEMTAEYRSALKSGGAGGVAGGWIRDKSMIRNGHVISFQRIFLNKRLPMRTCSALFFRSEKCLSNHIWMRSYVNEMRHVLWRQKLRIVAQ